MTRSGSNLVFFGDPILTRPCKILAQSTTTYYCSHYCLYYRLLDVLTDFATVDWSLAGLVCQVLWNYSTNIRSSSNTFGEPDSQQLIALLTDYIGQLNTLLFGRLLVQSVSECANFILFDFAFKNYRRNVDCTNIDVAMRFSY